MASATRRRNSRSCVQNTTVPRWPASRCSSQASASESRLLVGSSSSSTSGFAASTAASDARRPPRRKAWKTADPRGCSPAPAGGPRPQGAGRPRSRRGLRGVRPGARIPRGRRALVLASAREGLGRGSQACLELAYRGQGMGLEIGHAPPRVDSGCCGRQPMPPAACRIAVPDAGARSPASRRNSVVFPLPFSPITARRSPGRTEKSRSRNTGCAG